MIRVRKSICFEIVSKCNWDCSYCIADTGLSAPTTIPKMSFDDIINYIKIPRGENIVISGGEPGLVSTNKLIILARAIKAGIIGSNGSSGSNDFDINTNGTIFKKIMDLPEPERNIFLGLNYRYHLSETVKLERKREIAQNFGMLLNYNIEIEPQIVFTPEDTIQDIEKCFNELRMLIPLKFFRGIIFTPAVYSFKNKTKNCFKPTTGIIEYQRAIFKLYKSFGLPVTREREQSFLEALGEKRVIYKAHEI